MGRIETGPGWELRLGDYREVLEDVDSVDSVICDPPYSERTHRGNDNLAKLDRRTITYNAWNRVDAIEFVELWDRRVERWICVMCDHMLIEPYGTALRKVGRYGFAPVSIIQPRVRLSGDGPASSTVHMIVARPKDARFLRWGSLPGYYKTVIERNAHIGGKPISLMRAIVRDYSRKGDLVCDPCAGYGSTLLAAMIEGRRAIGAEVDPDTFAVAVDRLKKGFTPDMFQGDFPE